MDQIILDLVDLLIGVSHFLLVPLSITLQHINHHQVTMVIGDLPLLDMKELHLCDHTLRYIGLVYFATARIIIHITVKLIPTLMPTLILYGIKASVEIV